MRTRIFEIALGTFVGNGALLLFLWLAYASLSRLLGWD